MRAEGRDRRVGWHPRGVTSDSSQPLPTLMKRRWWVTITLALAGLVVLIWWLRQPDTEPMTEDADDSAQVSAEEQRLISVLTPHMQAGLGQDAFGAIPDGLPDDVLPAGTDPGFVAGAGDETGGWVAFVLAADPAEETLAAAAEHLSAAGYVEGDAADVRALNIAPPDSGDTAPYDELRTFSRDGLLVGVGATTADIGEDVALQSVLMYVVSPS